MNRQIKKKIRGTRDFLLAQINPLVYSFRNRSGTDMLINKREIRFFGLQRSGNHAIVNWIFKQCPGKKCCLNWVTPDTNPFYTFQKKSTIKEFQKDFKKKFNLTFEKIGFLSKKELLIYTYEDENLEIFNPSGIFCQKRKQWVGKSEKQFDIIILRDPYNLFASRLKKEDSIKENRYSIRKKDEREILIGLWKQYAREFLGETSFLPDKMAISYNKWFLDKSYRREFAEKLNLEFSDEGVEQVLQIGGGSSFDRMNFNQCALEMKVLERWVYYKDDPDFKAVFEDKELVELSEKIFGKIPGTNKFRS